MSRALPHDATPASGRSVAPSGAPASLDATAAPPSSSVAASCAASGAKADGLLEEGDEAQPTHVTATHDERIQLGTDMASPCASRRRPTAWHDEKVQSVCLFMPAA